MVIKNSACVTLQNVDLFKLLLNSTNINELIIHIIDELPLYLTNLTQDTLDLFRRLYSKISVLTVGLGKSLKMTLRRFVI